MYAIIRYTLLCAKRDYVILGVMIGLVASFLLSYFLGNTALIEEKEMVVSYFASSSRLVIVMGLILFVCFFIRRSFEHKEIELLLSHNIARWQCLIGFVIAMAFLAVVLCLPVAITMWVLARKLVGAFSVGCWALSIIAECWLVVCFSLAASLILQSAVSSSLLAIGFYMMGRMMGFVMGIIHHYTPLSDLASLPHWVMEHAITAVAMVLPRLDMFGKSEWLIYGVADQQILFHFGVQTLIFMPLLLLMAMIDFNRKEF